MATNGAPPKMWNTSRAYNGGICEPLADSLVDVQTYMCVAVFKNILKGLLWSTFSLNILHVEIGPGRL